MQLNHPRSASRLPHVSLPQTPAQTLIGMSIALPRSDPEQRVPRDLGLGRHKVRVSINPHRKTPILEECVMLRSAACDSVIPRTVHSVRRFVLQRINILLSTPLACLVALSGSLWAQASLPVGFQDHAAYDRGPTDSIDLYSLNLIASQPLSPTYNLGPTLDMKSFALYSGFPWTRTVQQADGALLSVYSRGVQPGIIGAGWRFDLGHIWTHTETYTYQQLQCTRAYNIYVSPDGGEHVITGSNLTTDGSLISVSGSSLIGPQGCPTFESDFPVRITELTDGHDYSRLEFDRDSGALTRVSDRYGNSRSITYMAPSDFLFIDPTATPEQYTYHQNRYHPHPSHAPRTLSQEPFHPPKSLTDSLGRTIEFKYYRLDGYPKFLLNEVHVPAPNGNAVYRLHYQLRSITTPPPGWPLFQPTGPTQFPFLVTVELPAGAPGTPPLTYNYETTIPTASSSRSGTHPGLAASFSGAMCLSPRPRPTAGSSRSASIPTLAIPPITSGVTRRPSIPISMRSVVISGSTIAIGP